MIKLAASDIDGTLVPEGTNELNEDIYGVIRRLQEKGILFAAASGRHYSSMRYLFDAIAEDIYFITENGSCVLKNEEIVSVTYIPPETAEAMVRYLRSLGVTEIILSTPEKLYTESPSEEFLKGLRSLHIQTEAVPDLIPYCRKTNKIAIYQQEAPEKLEKELQERFLDRLHGQSGGQGHRAARPAGKAWHHDGGDDGVWRQLQRHRHDKAGGGELCGGERASGSEGSCKIRGALLPGGRRSADAEGKASRGKR